MANSEFLPFSGVDTGTNLLTQSEYESDPQRLIGNQPGIARSALVNKAMKQASLMAAAVAKFIAENQDQDVVDTLSDDVISAMIGKVIKYGSAKVVKTINDVRTGDNTDRIFITVIGNSAVGDDGGWDFYYDNSDTTSADNGWSVLVDSSGKRWKRANLGRPINVAEFGDVFTSSGSANAAWAAAVAATGGIGYFVNPRNSLLDLSSVTVPNGAVVFDIPGQQLVLSNVGIRKSVGAGGGHLLFRDVRQNNATRIHVEPNGYPVGVTSKYDWMFDPYDTDTTNYRIANLYTKTYDPADASTTVGNNGVAVIGIKGVGRNFGIWPTLHFGFSDDGAGAAVPMKMYYFDTSDTIWRTPMKGAWRSGVSVTSGDYMLSANKLYQATSTGTAGSTAPTHAAGTVSDGGVDWAFVRNYAAVSANIKGCMVFGDRDDLPKFGNPNVRVQYAKDIALWNGVNLTTFDNTGTAKWNIYQILNGADLYIKTADGTKGLRFGQNGFFQLLGMPLATDTKGETSGASSISVAGVNELVCGNTGPTTISEFTGMVPGQVFWVSASNGQTTLQASGSIRLKGGAASYLLAANDVLMFKVNSEGTIAREVGR